MVCKKFVLLYKITGELIVNLKNTVRKNTVRCSRIQIGSVEKTGSKMGRAKQGRLPPAQRESSEFGHVFLVPLCFSIL